MRTVIVGIDPDIDKSGYAEKEKESGKLIRLTTFSFGGLVRELCMQSLLYDIVIVVVIEAGWLNKKSSWHGRGKKDYVREKIAKNIGENHAVGKCLASFCEVYHIPYKLICPTSRKKNANMFRLITGWTGETNQEMRDAGMIAWNYNELIEERM